MSCRDLNMNSVNPKIQKKKIARVVMLARPPVKPPHSLQLHSLDPTLPCVSSERVLILQTGFNKNSQAKQPSITTDFNSSCLCCEFIYNNTPYGVVQLRPTGGNLQNREQREERWEDSISRTSNFSNILNTELKKMTMEASSHVMNAVCRWPPLKKP